MRLPARLWLLAGAGLLGLIGLGMLLQLVNQLTWQLSAVLPYPLVGPALLVLVLIVLAGGVQIGWPLLRPWLEPALPAWIRNRLPRRPGPGQASGPAPAAPATSRREAASRNLEAMFDEISQRVAVVARDVTATFQTHKL